MKKILFAGLAGMTLGVGLMAVAEPVHDWKGLDAVHLHVESAIKELQDVQAANHYDMSGHARKAESLLHDAEGELRAAVDAAKNGK